MAPARRLYAKRIATLGVALLGAPAFADPCQIFDQLDQFTVAAHPPAHATCQAYQAQSGAGVSCHWAFPFRSPSALGFADQLWRDARSCRGGQPQGPDALVNHPDSYDLRALTSATGTYSVSVKDKGGLQQTLVFLRRSP